MVSLPITGVSAARLSNSLVVQTTLDPNCWRGLKLLSRFRAGPIDRPGLASVGDSGNRESSSEVNLLERRPPSDVVLVREAGRVDAGHSDRVADALARHPGVGGFDQFPALIATHQLTEPTASRGGMCLHL